MTSAVNRSHVQRCISELLLALYSSIPRDVLQEAAEAAVRRVEDGLDEAAKAKAVSDEAVPPRVLAAEGRREFRELLTRSSLGCSCGHMLADHDADGWLRDGSPVNRRCRDADCDCGRTS